MELSRPGFNSRSTTILENAGHRLSIENSSSQFGHCITACEPQSHSISSIKSKITLTLQELHSKRRVSNLFITLNLQQNY